MDRSVYMKFSRLSRAYGQWVGYTLRGVGLPEVPDVDLAKAESLDHPLVLGVTIAVLVGTESVGNTLDRVHDGASKVVSRVYLPLVADRAMSGVLPTVVE